MTETEERAGQSDGSSAARVLKRLAPLFLVGSLIALFLVPLAIGARTLPAATTTSDVHEPAQLALSVVALTTTSQSAAIRALAIVTPEAARAFAADYRSSRRRQRAAFEELTALMPLLDVQTQRHIVQLRGSLARWHRQHDSLLAGDISREQYSAELDTQQRHLQAVLTDSDAAFTSLNVETHRLRAHLSRLARLQAVLTAGLAGLALTSIFIAFWLAARARRLDDALRERAVAEQLADARADVLSWVSHDLKNPLAAIRMACTNLRRSLEKSPARAPQIVATIDRSALRMSRLIRDLLDSARLDAGRALVMDTRDVDLDELLLRTCEEGEQMSGGDVKVRCSAERGLPRVRGDRLRLEQAVLNLLQNALRASPPDGVVQVEAARVGALVRVAVHDDGPGVPPEVLPRLFTPFRSARRSDSTGLGLFIVKGVVEAHGGEVWLESGPGPGTTFYFTVPVAAANEPETQPET